MARRAFADLKTEHIARVGRVGDTSYATRAEEFIKAAYFYLANGWVHYELVSLTAALSVATTTNLYSSVTLPSASGTLPNVVFAVLLQGSASGTAPTKPLERQDLRYLLARLAPGQAAGEPSAYARAGTTLLVFDRIVTLPRVAFVAYQAIPAEPSFASGGSALQVEWDEAILDLSLVYAYRALWRPDMADERQRLVDAFLENTPAPRLRDSPAFGVPFEPTAKAPPVGGGRG